MANHRGQMAILAVDEVQARAHCTWHSWRELYQRGVMPLVPMVSTAVQRSSRTQSALCHQLPSSETPLFDTVFTGSKPPAESLPMSRQDHSSLL
jgi:hypothetical protein